MTNKTEEQQNAGFWIRLLATWIDFILIYLILKGIFYLFLCFHINIYFPFEFTFFLLTITYGSVSVSFDGNTLGKWLLDLKVVNKNNKKLSIIQSILRESILKPFSFLILTIGFIWIGFSKKKKGLHDYIDGSKVIRTDNQKKRTILWETATIISLIAIMGNNIWQVSSLIYRGIRMELPKKTFDLAFVNRPLSKITDISKITSDTIFVNWLNKHAQSPDSFAVETASKYQLTIFGESHGCKDNLDFFNRIIPDLYLKARVRCIGMECISSSMNEKLTELINSKDFNEELSLQIARSQIWKMWGMQEYWDVLRTVWKLNKNLPDSCPKMRVVGIDLDWVGPRIAMVLPNGSDDGLKRVPFWEKFKFFTSIGDFVKLIYRDELMASNVENEIIKKGNKGVVWIGSAHTPLNYGNPIIFNNKVLFVKARFGLILNQKYKDQIGQILLWQSMADEKNKNGELDKFIEAAMYKHDTVPAGFTIKNSPFATIRDNDANYFNKYQSICFEDITQGLVFLKPLNKLEPCTWTKNFISREMFLKYKPFYEIKRNQKISDNEECNILFKKSLEENK